MQGLVYRGQGVAGGRGDEASQAALRCRILRSALLLNGPQIPRIKLVEIRIPFRSYP